MLVEVQCDKFIEHGEIRKPIQFHAGLNTVIGDDNGSNWVHLQISDKPGRFGINYLFLKKHSLLSPEEPHFHPTDRSLALLAMQEVTPLYPPSISCLITLIVPA